MRLQVIASQNFLVNHFFGENCKKNLCCPIFVHKIVPSNTYLNSYETSLILLELNCFTFFKKDAGSL